MIPFFRPYGLPSASKYIEELLANGQLSGDGIYTNRCVQWLNKRLNVPSVLMTTSCTHALELACFAIGLEAEDEVIVPSYTYPSTANSVIMNGGKIVYCEVEEAHMTMNPAKLQGHITEKTKAIIVVHYGGVACDMDPIMTIAKAHDLIVIEDSAQGFLATYKGRMLGTIGDFGCFSFHGTKDIVAGEGGALVINNKQFVEPLSIMRMKGTNQMAFKKGLVSHYEWVAKGSSYSPSDLLMAVLYSQFLIADEIVSAKVVRYERYRVLFERKAYDILKSYSSPIEASHVNGHLFYIEFKESEDAKAFISYMSAQEIAVYTHFIPLHQSLMGKQFIRDLNQFQVEDGIGNRLVRLPLYADMSQVEQCFVLEHIERFMEAIQ